MGDRGTIDAILEMGGAPRIRDLDRARIAGSVEKGVEELEGDALKGLWTVEGRVDERSRIQPHVWR